MNRLLSLLTGRFTSLMGRGRSPIQDWFALLAFSLIVLIASVVWNAWLFGRVEQGGVLGGATVSLPPVFNRSSLEMVEKIFAERKVEEVKYMNGTYRFVDPSK